MKGYELLERLSVTDEGNTVFKAKRTRDGTEFAVKQVSYAGIARADRSRMVETTNTLIQLSRNSTGLVHYHNTQVDTDNGVVYLVMDFYEKGSLEKLLSESRHPLDTEKIWTIVTDIALGLYDCHFNEPSLAHGALTPDHVFFGNDGFTRIGCLSLNSCPDVDKDEDLKNLGAILYRMATLQQFVSKRQISTSDSVFKRLDDGIKRVLIGLLNPSHSTERLTLQKLMEIPEIALKVLQKKIKIESEIYEQEKQRYKAKEADIIRREKALGLNPDKDDQDK